MAAVRIMKMVGGALHQCATDEALHACMPFLTKLRSLFSVQLHGIETEGSIYLVKV